MRLDGGMEIGQQPRRLGGVQRNQALKKARPDQGNGFSVVLQQVVHGGQLQGLQQRQRCAAQQGCEPAVEGADLHGPTGLEHVAV
jgi:hypothetical protein